MAITAGGWACNADNGRGSLQGTVAVAACRLNDDRVLPFNDSALVKGQQWNFFVGEPFNSTTPRFPANQINIRMQSQPARLELSDALTFWVLDSYEVARCVRGGVKPEDGTPDWDPAVCDRSPVAGEGRVLVGTEHEVIRSHFVLFDSCPLGLPSATALGSCAGGTCPMALCPGRASWITFSKFGVIPTGSPNTSFRVNDDESVAASAFHVEFCDQATIDAKLKGVVPLPTPNIIGVLDGSFEFVMKQSFW
ncbi:MAG: hypothetical protein ABUS79_01310 [Pseudomonadota bacterium]